MKTAWMQGLRGEEAEVFKREVVAAQKVLDKLREIVYNRLKEVRSVPSTDYDCPSWSHKQAHQNGEVAALEGVISLLSF